MAEYSTPGTTDPSSLVVHVHRHSVPGTVAAVGLVGAEVVDIELKTPAGNIICHQLTESTPHWAILSPGAWRLAKPITSGPVSLYAMVTGIAEESA